MLILCWNVAGLSTTVNRIHDSYVSRFQPDAKRKRGRSNVVLAEYFHRHGADIVCLQEHKIPLSQLSTRSEPLGCSDVEGYESFWSCCVDKNKKGLNGVVTYVRKRNQDGVDCSAPGVLKANAAPLGSPDLDEQGRCVMTDHGSFVVFNVYVPASSGQPLSYKMKFLNALRRAMSEQRTSHNKNVILVGDLNISHLPIDKFWSDRVLFVDDIRREVASQTSATTNAEEAPPPKLPKWKNDVATAWSKIETALATKNVVQTQTMNSLTNKKYDKHRMAIEVNGKQVFLGSHESHHGYCEYPYHFDSLHYTCADTGELLLAEEENVVSISTMAELLLKIGGIEWSESLRREIAATDGGTGRINPPRRWLDSVLEEDGMVDTFRRLHPQAEGRFTCWNQFTNKRYTNEGARIDFALVDTSLFPMVQTGGVKGLRCGCATNADSQPNHPADAESAALCAATAKGGFQAVSFEGGGIIEATQQTLDTQFGPPHTGIVYTPPSFSDHTAISLLLDDECCCASQEMKLNQQDAATRRAQPHKSQKSISSFFPVATPTTAASSGNLSSAKNGKRKQGIHNFFAAKTAPDSGNSNSTSTNNRQGCEKQRRLQGEASGTKVKTKLPTVAPKGKNSVLGHFERKK